MRNRLTSLFTLWAMALCACTQAAAVLPLESLRQEHPRLMLTPERLAALKALAQTDAALQSYVAQGMAQADALLDAKPLEHTLIGPRMLSVSHECVERVYALGLAWRWTGEKKYAEAVKANLLTVCAFPDWNPSHFLDTAEMAHAVGVGYDWIFDALGDEERKTIRSGLIALGLTPGIEAYRKGTWWTTSEFNWNQVCNGGMLVGALAIAESDPQYAETIVPKAVASLPRAIASYDPDGAWMEGPSYWHYATRYTAYGICTMDTALGTDFGVSDAPGLRAAGHFPIYCAGPSGLYLNYADSGERGARRPMPCMFWLAQKYGDTALSDDEHGAVARHGAKPEHVLWYVPPSPAQAERALDRHFRGKVAVVVMRSAWDDPNALFVGVKAGYNQVNHGHLDLGNFELDALGARWARDLGRDDYNLPGYWDKGPGGKRWDYYRLNSRSHNVPLINGENQDARGTATVVSFESAPEQARARLDLSGAYRAHAHSVTREVALVDRRRRVLIEDRFDMIAPSEILWGMTTDAEIAIEAGNRARLRLGDRELIAEALSPGSAHFSVESAEQEPPQESNKGVRRLLLRVPEADGKVTVQVRLSPVWPE